MTLALNNGRAFINGKLETANILIENGRIEKILPHRIQCDKEIDCAGKIILPGAIDAHVHFRCPGFEYKEDWVSGSLAALHGGVTTVMDMPNTNPATTTAALLEEKRKIVAKDAAVNFDLYMAATESNLAEIEKACASGLRAVKLYYGSTTGGIMLNRRESIESLFRLAKDKGLVIVAHAEDEEEVKKNKEKFRGKKNPAIHEKIRTDIAEAKAIAALVALQSKIGNRLHIAHLSSKKGLEEVKKGKRGKHGKSVSCEAAPQHLFLDDSCYKKLGNLAKCNPSIKKSADRKALWKGLKEGTIDIVATDHAPHAPEEKAKGYWECPSGVPGVETLMPLLLDAANAKKIPLERVVNAACERPAQLFGWGSKGFIREGFDADLAIVDMERVFKVENDALFTKARYSPFNGWKLKGFVEKTIVRGEVFG